MLRLQEGLRQIAITIDFKTEGGTALSGFTPTVLNEILTIYVSGEKTGLVRLISKRRLIRILNQVFHPQN